MTSYAIIGIYDGVPFMLYRDGMWSNRTLDPARSRRWKTRAGAARYIQREKAAGSEWELAVLTIEEDCP
jgi:hypothetical protein